MIHGSILEVKRIYIVLSWWLFWKNGNGDNPTNSLGSTLKWTYLTPGQLCAHVADRFRTRLLGRRPSSKVCTKAREREDRQNLMLPTWCAILTAPWDLTEMLVLIEMCPRRPVAMFTSNYYFRQSNDEVPRFCLFMMLKCFWVKEKICVNWQFGQYWLGETVRQQLHVHSVGKHVCWWQSSLNPEILAA